MKTYQNYEINLNSFPKVNLIHQPTPLMKLPALSEALKGPEIYIKRDDLTGFASGGNKSRKLEYIIGDALSKKADSIITWGSVQSNWCLQTAAAAQKYGIKPILILFKNGCNSPNPEGNLFLDSILDAEIKIMDQPGEGDHIPIETYMDIMNEIAEAEKRKGVKPYIIPVGGSMVAGDMKIPLGALSYIKAFAEISEQTEALGFQSNAVIHATGSGGTQAGLIIGARVLHSETKIVGISVSHLKDILVANLKKIIGAMERTLGIDSVSNLRDIIVLDKYIQEGYGIVNRGVAEIIRLVFKTEGIILDPVYTAKGMVALYDLVSKKYFGRTDKIVFIHTGGTPALFASMNEILTYL